MKKIIGFLSLATILSAISCTGKKQKEESSDLKKNETIEVTVPAPQPPPPPPSTITIKLPPLPPPPPLPPKPKKNG